MFSDQCVVFLYILLCILELGLPFKPEEPVKVELFKRVSEKQTIKFDGVPISLLDAVVVLGY